MSPRVAAAAAVSVLAALAVAGSAHAAVRDVTLRYGPISIGPYQGKRDGTPVRAPRVDGSIVAMDANVVDARDRVIPQSVVMLHHLVFKDAGHPGNLKRDGACPGSGGDQRFYGESEELRPMTLPPGFGYPIEREDSWRMGWMLMNHTHRSHSAWIRYHMRIDTRRLRPVTPYWLSVMGCHVDPQFTVPGGGAGPASTYARVRDFTVPRDGRIVAVGGHLHGGGRDVTLSQPRCRNRTLVTSRPTYGDPDDPVYRVRPLLHEPDPRSISWWQSATGIPVRAGERLRVTARYRNDFPYMRVMGIDHVYVAHGASGPAGCSPPPADARVLGAPFRGRATPPHMDLTLARLRPDGYAHPYPGPAGLTAVRGDRAAIAERGWSFGPARVSVVAGGRIRWRFHDGDLHDATLAAGPRGFSSPPMRGGSYSHRFDLPGTYRVYCSLHPIEMQQVVTVRAVGPRLPFATRR